MVVVGYRKQPKDFGWILADSEGKYMGVMELGVPAQARARVYRSDVSKETDDVAYLATPIGVRAKYRNLTKAGLLRLSSFVEWA